MLFDDDDDDDDDVRHCFQPFTVAVVSKTNIFRHLLL